MRLKDQVALVTGAGTGLGEGIALRFAEEGAVVGLVGRREEKLNQVAARIQEAGGQARIFPADVTRHGDMDRVSESLLAEFGRVDCLVANAGVVFAREAATETTEEDWNTTLAVNLTGVHYSCKAVLPAMVLKQSGSIVTISSISGQIAMARRASYGASKAGVLGYTRNLAADYASWGIRANCVCPGFVETDINRESLAAVRKDPEQWQAFLAKSPLGLGKPEDVANAALFLCSTEGRWITGAELTVDGGYTVA